MFTKYYRIYSAVRSVFISRTALGGSGDTKGKRFIRRILFDDFALKEQISVDA